MRWTFAGPATAACWKQLGTYDPLVPETDARAVLNGERIAYWLSVGAQPSDKVQVLIKKYGAGGTHLAEQKAALGPAGPEPPSARAAAADARAPKPAEPAEEKGKPASASKRSSRKAAKRPPRREDRSDERRGPARPPGEPACGRREDGKPVLRPPRT